MFGKAPFVSFLVTGVDTRTGAKVQLQRPANFDDAVKKLGLEHALGSLRFMRSTPATTSHSDENTNRGNLPVDSAQASKEAAAARGDAGEKDDGDWVPLHLQLGLPLAPAGLCDLVCRYDTPVPSCCDHRCCFCARRVPVQFACSHEAHASLTLRQCFKMLALINLHLFCTKLKTLLALWS